MIRLSVAALAALAACQAVAQSVPQVVIPPAAEAGALQQRQIESEQRRREAERELRQPAEPLVRPSAPTGATVAADNGVRVAVKEVRFTPSEILSAEALEAVAADYRGKQVSLTELQQLAARVNALYKAKGVVTALATIPQQDVTAGVIEVRLVEGRVGAVRVEGNASTETDFITNRLGLQAGQLVDLDKLEQGLVWFNRTNDVRLQAELKPGAVFSTTDIQVGVTEPPRHEMLLTLDNMGSKLTGAWRAGVSYRNRSLLGLRDDLSLSYTRARGQDSRAASYSVAANRYGGRLSLGLYEDRTSIEYGPLSSLNITGESRARVLSFRQPVWIDARSQWDIVAGTKRRVSSNEIDDVFLQRTDSKDRSLGAEWQWNNDASAVTASYIKYWTDATVLSREKYQIDRASLRYNQLLTESISLRGSLGGQWARDKNLPSGEQFFLGGEGSVRGYPVGTYSGDQGYTVNLELHHPLLNTTVGSQTLASTGFFFVDHGRTAPFRPPASLLPAHEKLTGIGWGLNALIGKRTSVRLTLGYGLDDVPLSNKNYQVTVQLISSLL
ncbi:ShlB/FhaC/HecB family hemolysin secretion/activation protein [Variovorax guangxiensis]|uniref:ShlB/FhaC/HecB family hemolysin secretion/activation protein n=1 Tax=Variovorax guangxiensis TaxID=1775474 RepID=UPI00112883BF|nr:ShlB/FhaC/HecB family hemolysin secretion/activation protein [Variovorax guangxiensis]RZI68620.1 MAG: ShlB/FhaC/HecB family hemolysin secretion/activation protein [Variovorax sp.]